MDYIYKKRSLMTWMIGNLRNLTTANTHVRISNSNKLNDYYELLKAKNDDLWELHCNMADIRKRMHSNYDSYDYGNGYFYQSFHQIGVSGYRNTEERVKQLQLKTLLKGKKVLDIGSNASFLLFALDDIYKSAVGIEYNPYLVEMANLVKAYLGKENIQLINTSFEMYVKQGSHEKFDVVLSLANHSTYDGNTKQSVHQYFKNISKTLNTGGVIIFESHPPELEPKNKLDETIKALLSFFEVVQKPKIKMKNFLDKDRTYIVGRLK